MNQGINISQIENWLRAVLYKAVSNTVVVGTLPITLSAKCKDMVLVDVIESADSTDFGRNMGRALANVYLYAAPTSTGHKNVAKLNEMEEMTNVVMEDVDHESYSVSELRSTSDFDSQIKWHYIVKSYRILIS